MDQFHANHKSVITPMTSITKRPHSRHSRRKYTTLSLSKNATEMNTIIKTLQDALTYFNNCWNEKLPSEIAFPAFRS
jgi:hypothetical protein